MTFFVSGRRLLAAGLALAALAVPLPALADPTAAQRVEAQALFDDARKLMGDKRYAEACPKLEGSQHLDPGLGTLLYLAECQAQTGKTASAWANFLDAAYTARMTGQTSRENAARAKAAKLERRLSRVTIIAANAETMELSRDGAVLLPSLVGTAVPLDPGEHVIRATSPGKKPWETTITVKDDGQPITVSVPRLEAEAPPPPPPPPPVVVPPPPPPPVVAPPPPPPVVAPPPPPPPPQTGRRVAGIVLTIVGVGGLGTSAAFAVMAKQKYNTSLKDCPSDPNVCNPKGFAERNDARKAGDVATVAVIAGLGVTAGGLGLALSTIPPSATPHGAALMLNATVDPTGGVGLDLKGRF